MMKINKGSIYYTNMVQNEKNSTPVLVIQNNIGNEINSTTIITPIIEKVVGWIEKNPKLTATIFTVITAVA